MRFVIAVLLASVCFGTTGTAQALGPEADPASLGAARLVIGGGALGALALATRLGRRRDADGTPVASPTGIRTRRPLIELLLVATGAAGVLAYQPAFFAGTEANGVAIGTVVALGSAPVLTGAIDWALRRRYPGHRWAVATAIATAGVAVIALASAPSGGVTASTDPLGLLASLGAGASYAVYTLAAKGLIDRGWSATASMGALFGTGALFALPLLIATDASWLATPAGLSMALWLGFVTVTVAYLLFGYGLTALAPATVSTLTLAEPLTAGLLGVLVLGEVLPAGAVLGLAVLATGIVVLASGGREAGRSGRGPARSSDPGEPAEAPGLRVTGGR